MPNSWFTRCGRPWCRPWSAPLNGMNAAPAFHQQNRRLSVRVARRQNCCKHPYCKVIRTRRTAQPIRNTPVVRVPNGRAARASKSRTQANDVRRRHWTLKPSDPWTSTPAEPCDDRVVQPPNTYKIWNKTILLFGAAAPGASVAQCVGHMALAEGTLSDGGGEISEKMHEGPQHAGK
jgi:hypothetical protein